MTCVACGRTWTRSPSTGHCLRQKGSWWGPNTDGRPTGSCLEISILPEVTSTCNMQGCRIEPRPSNWRMTTYYNDGGTRLSQSVSPPLPLKKLCGFPGSTTSVRMSVPYQMVAQGLTQGLVNSSTGDCNLLLAGVHAYTIQLLQPIWMQQLNWSLTCSASSTLDSSYAPCCGCSNSGHWYLPTVLWVTKAHHKSNIFQPDHDAILLQVNLLIPYFWRYTVSVAG